VSARGESAEQHCALRFAPIVLRCVICSGRWCALHGDSYAIASPPLIAAELFLSRLKGITEPEAKRKIIGHTFIEVFEEEVRACGAVAAQCRPWSSSVATRCRLDVTLTLEITICLLTLTFLCPTSAGQGHRLPRGRQGRVPAAGHPVPRRDREHLLPRPLRNHQEPPQRGRTAGRHVSALHRRFSCRSAANLFMPNGSRSAA